MSPDHLTPDEERRLLERLAERIHAYRTEKRRLEFERRLFFGRRPVTQSGFCLN
jgi:hypothetical protein